jgi:hypothetical protein
VWNDLRALFARLPPGTVLGYESAAAVYGFAPAERLTPVHVIVPAGTVRPRIRGVVVHEAVLPVDPPFAMAGVPFAPAARCAIDLARGADGPGGLAILDAALRVGACDRDDLATEVGLHARLRGVYGVRALVNLADGGAQCAEESHLRFIIRGGGLPAPETQLWVDDGTGYRGYGIDLAYRERKLGLEYDGEPASIRERLDERSRRRWLRSRGWTIRSFTAADMTVRPDLIVAEVRALLADPPPHAKSILQFQPDLLHRYAPD